MSDKVAQPLGDIVAANVRRWRLKRGLDQQALADRLAEVGWRVDRTTVVRIEKPSSDPKRRRITVDDLGRLAVALNVPLPLLLLPVHDGNDVQLTPTGRTASVNRWYLWEWMRGEQPLPGRSTDEWRTGVAPLWAYERVRAAQLHLQAIQVRRGRALDDEDYRLALQQLVDAVDAMESLGLPTEADLVAPEWREDIKQAGLKPTPRGRYRSVEEAEKGEARATRSPSAPTATCSQA